MTFETADYVRRFSGPELLLWYRNGGEIPRQQEAALATAIAAEGADPPPPPAIPRIDEPRCWGPVRVRYDGKEYPSFHACERETGISRHTLRGWAKRRKGKVLRIEEPLPRRTA